MNMFAGFFSGFHGPEANWSKLPNDLIDAFPLIETLGEALVVLYVLRHTWGYGDEEKWITMNEFMYGRKRRNGTRIDHGTGLTAPTIRDGLVRAVRHGFLVVRTDDSDLARIRHYYALREFAEEGENFFPQMERSFPPDGKKLSPRAKEVFPGGKDSLQRTEKETVRKKPPAETIETVSEPSGEKEINASQLWANALAELQLQMTKATFDTWLRATEAVSYQTGDQVPLLTVTTRSPYGLSWLEQKLRGPIERTVNYIAGKSVEVKFILKTDTPPADAKEEQL